VRLKSVALATVFLGLSLGLWYPPAGAADRGHDGARVSFVLAPRWVPPGWTGATVYPGGGLTIYPRSRAETRGASSGTRSHGSGSLSTPPLFTLTYYDELNATNFVYLNATPLTGKGWPPRRDVKVASQRQSGGTFAVTYTFATWEERGDLVVVFANGLTSAQLTRFIDSLVEVPISRLPASVTHTHWRCSESSGANCTC